MIFRQTALAHIALCCLPGGSDYTVWDTNMEKSGIINSTVSYPTDTNASADCARALALNHAVCSSDELATSVHDTPTDRIDAQSGATIQSRSVKCMCQQLSSERKFYKMGLASDYDRNLRLEYWSERFLDIPAEEFIPINNSIMQRFNNSYKRAIEMAKSDDDRFQMKIKWLIARTLHDWQTNRNREQTKKQLVSLQNYCDPEYDICNFIETWFLMKTLGDMLFKKTVDEFDKEQLLLLINRKSIEFFTKEKKIAALYFEELDIIPLIVFYYFGALPGYNEMANYEMAFRFLRELQDTMAFDYQFFSPVSFTIFDYMRLFPDDFIEKLDEQKTAFSDEKSSITGMMVISLLAEDRYDSEKKYRKNLSDWIKENKNGFSIFAFCNMLVILTKYYNLLSGIEQKKSRPADISSFLREVTEILNLPPRKQIGFGNSIGLLYFIKSRIILNTSKQKKRTIYMQLASLYKDAEQIAPNHCSSTYYYYRMAGSYTAAAEAAKRYADYLRCGNNQLVAEHWNSLSDRELLLAEEDKQIQASDYSEDIDDSILDFPDPPPKSQPKQASIKGSKRNKHKKKHKHVSSSSSTTSKNDDKEVKLELQNDELLVKARPSRHCRPIVKAVPFRANIENLMAADGQPFLIKSKQGGIKPFEKLLSRHWNPLIKKALRAIRNARVESDSHREHEIYHTILTDPEKKACIGIERIWEEYAWTKLHELDHCFRIQSIPRIMRKVAKKWIEQARGYLMPCFAYCLELDQINARISPEALWQAVIVLVEFLEKKEPADSREIRFRLRCMFSSMGHTCSLEAMLESENRSKSEHLSDEARKWYKYKEIDPDYDKKTKIAQPT